MFEKIKDLLKGENKAVHKRKRKYNLEMMQIHEQAKAQVISSQKTVTMIENSTAYRIAQATGKMRLK